MRKVIAVVGPTATGKTDAGVLLAEAVGGEVISADSRLVYRELALGTAKPTPEETRRVPHHLIDCVAPNEAYSVARYRQEASAVLERLLAEGKTPIVVGGTGYYLRALLQDAPLPDVPPDEGFRARMRALAAREGPEALHARLQARDPERAAMLYPADTFRVIRALEIIEQTGGPVPRVDFETVADRRDLDVTWVGLTFDNRDTLRARIDRRIDAMLAAGWLEEVRGLLAAYGPGAEALRVAHGYPELVAVLQGHCSLAEAREQIRINVRQYARRQRTWFHRNPRITWLALDDASPADLARRLREIAQGH